MPDSLPIMLEEGAAIVRPRFRRRKPKNWLLIVHCELQDWLCWYCRRKMTRRGKLAEAPSLDHLHPVAKGGHTCLPNTAAACRACNEDKGHLTEAEYRAVLAVRREAAEAAGDGRASLWSKCSS